MKSSTKVSITNGMAVGLIVYISGFTFGEWEYWAQLFLMIILISSRDIFGDR